MRVPAFAVFLLFPLVAGYLVGVWRGRDLGRSDKKDLKELRDLRWWMVRHAAEHEALGDNFAVLVNQRLGEHFEKGTSS